MGEAYPCQLEGTTPQLGTGGAYRQALLPWLADDAGSAGVMERVSVGDSERGAADGSLSQPAADSGEGGEGAGDGEGRPSDEPGEPGFPVGERFHPRVVPGKSRSLPAVRHWVEHDAPGHYR